MRGLIYKDFSVFYKSIDKRTIIIIVGAIALILYRLGNYGGLLASLIFAMTVGMQNIMSFVNDDKAHWKKYQMALPLSDFSVVASKYISVLCTLGISILGSVALNLLSSIIFHSFSPEFYGIAVFMAVFIPLLWTGICLPLIYWFGVQSAQIASMFVVFLPILFEYTHGLPVRKDLNMFSLFFLVGVVIFAIFGLSLLISVKGYRRRQ